jgi:intracellular multiplication protein IcmB
VSSLGPVELWALSTRPGDTSLRNRLYDKVGFSEGLRRLSKVFPSGSAMEGRDSNRAMPSIASRPVSSTGWRAELIEGHSLGLVLRPHEEANSGEQRISAD